MSNIFLKPQTFKHTSVCTFYTGIATWRARRQVCAYKTLALIIYLLNMLFLTVDAFGGSAMSTKSWMLLLSAGKGWNYITSFSWSRHFLAWLIRAKQRAIKTIIFYGAPAAQEAAERSPILTILLVFMWRSHIPKLKITFPSEVLASSDYRPYGDLAFYNVLARQGSSFCNRARLNFQGFALGD